MMDGSSAAELFNLYIFTAGRTVYAANQVGERARAEGLDRIAAAAGRAAESGHAQQEIELRWEARDRLSRPRHDPAAMSGDT